MAEPDPDLDRSWQQRLRLPLMIAGPILVLVVGIYWYLTSGRYETTDDAYVQAARVAISANVSGRVEEVAVHENETVRKGDALFRLDVQPFRIVVEEARAQLAAARLQIETLKANYRQRMSELRSAQETQAFQQHEMDRQQRLMSAGISSQLQLDRARHSLDEARSQVSTVQQQIGAVTASLAGNPDILPEHHPLVAQAQAQLDRADLNLSYTVIKAPSDGIVTRVEELQVGSYISASTPVFALVSRNDVWIEANFKENQLAHMRVGQPVNVKIDSYPGKTFKAKVSSLSPGTGSQFSALPAENATGNWVKVVQRLPVRVELDRVDPEYPMQSGLSANVRVDVQADPPERSVAQSNSSDGRTDITVAAK